MTWLTRWMDDHLYPHFQENWDNSAFRDTVLPTLCSDSKLLDLGAGAGIVSQTNFRHRVARVCGVDPDCRVLANPFLDEAKQNDGDRIPYPDESFDIVIANNVLEHLEHPGAVFAEVARVLKPSGLFIVKTPNKLHYVPLIASCTPQWFHQLVNRWRGRSVDDTFPTRYYANTPREIHHHAMESGLLTAQLRLIEGRPEYLRMTALTYVAGWLYERLVNLVPVLFRFRGVMIAILQKQIPHPTAANSERRAA